VCSREHTRLVPAAILDYTITLYFQKGPRMQNSLTQPRPLTSDSIIQFSPSTFSPESPAGSRRWLNRRSRSLKPFTFVHGETGGGEGRGLPRKRALARCVRRSRNSLNGHSGNARSGRDLRLNSGDNERRDDAGTAAEKQGARGTLGSSALRVTGEVTR